MIDEPEQYLKKTVMSSVSLSAGLALIVFFFFSSPLALLAVVFFIPMLFMYFMRYVDVKVEKIKKQVDQQIIFAGRFLIIGLESGVPIYKIFEDVEKNYSAIGPYFGEVLNKVYLGTSMEDAINDTLLECPSHNLRRLLWQVLNSLKTGTEVAPALNSAIDQIVKEQDIAVKEYGKKLSPMAMFYMMISLILPSLGITMLVVLATFLGLNITLPFFIVIAILLGFVQLMFLFMVRSARPAISY